MSIDYLSKPNIYVLITSQSDAGDSMNKVVQNHKDVYHISNRFFKIPFSFLSPLKLIKHETGKKNAPYSFEDIVSLLQFDDEVTKRLERPFRYQGNNKYFFSFAYGFAKGKKKFIMPWQPQQALACQEYRYNLMSEAVKKTGCTIVFTIDKLPENSFLNGEDVKKIDFNKY